MIVTGQLLLEDSASQFRLSRCRLSPGFIRVIDDTITEVVEGEIATSFDVGGPDYLIAPGFIDAHLHLPQFDIIGGHGFPLLQWLNDVTFPAEGRWQDVDFARSMTQRVLNQCIAHGTTAICAYATVHHQSAAAAIEIATQMRMRGVIGHVLMDREAPDYLCRDKHELIDQTSDLVDRFPPSARMAAAVTPRFAISCTEDLLIAAGRLAKEKGTLIQTHLAETIAECEFVGQLFGGKSYVDVYDETGLLTPKSIFGHGIYLDSDSRLKLAMRESTIAHCPTANSFLRSGTMNRTGLQNDGVKHVLGSDIGAGYERSMVRVARAMIEAAATLGDSYPSAAEAWHSITAGNADQLGWSDSGRLRTGSSADFVVIKPNIAWQDCLVDPLAMLMFAWDDRWIQNVFLRGK